MEVPLDALHQRRRRADQLPVREPAVFQTARVQRNGAVRVERLHLARNQVVLRVQRAHVQLVHRVSPALRAAGQVHGAQLQDRVLPPADVQLPPLPRDVHDAPEHDVACFRDVARAQRAHGDELVDALDRAADGGEQPAIRHARAVAAQESVIHIHALDGVPGGDERSVAGRACGGSSENSSENSSERGASEVGASEYHVRRAAAVVPRRQERRDRCREKRENERRWAAAAASAACRTGKV